MKAISTWRHQEWVHEWKLWRWDARIWKSRHKMMISAILVNQNGKILAIFGATMNFTRMNETISRWRHQEGAPEWKLRTCDARYWRNRQKNWRFWPQNDKILTIFFAKKDHKWILLGWKKPISRWRHQEWAHEWKLWTSDARFWRNRRKTVDFGQFGSKWQNFGEHLMHGF